VQNNGILKFGYNFYNFKQEVKNGKLFNLIKKVIQRDLLSEVQPQPEARARVPTKSSPAMERDGRRMVPMSVNYFEFRGNHFKRCIIFAPN
jgi:hypothetical protein